MVGKLEGILMSAVIEKYSLEQIIKTAESNGLNEEVVKVLVENKSI